MVQDLVQVVIRCVAHPLELSPTSSRFTHHIGVGSLPAISL
jgi:hypothetical protein